MGVEPEFIIEPERPRITLERVFDAPRRKVFEAWTRADEVKCWYSPSGFVVCDCDIDFRVNGKWRVLLRGPKGQEHRISGEYREIETPERLVQTFRYDGAPQAEAVETLVFAEKDGKTLLTSTVVHESAENRDWHVRSGLREGATEILDRLSDHLASSAADATGAARALASSGAPTLRARQIWKIAAAALALAALAGGGLYWSSRHSAVQYVKETIGRGSVIRAASVNGVIAPVGAAPIRARAAGAIEAVYCDVGAKVTAGQLCAKLDPAPYRSAVEREKAELADALARQNKDDAQLARTRAESERLTKRKTASQNARDKARAAFEQAQARAASSEAAVARSRAALQSAEASLAQANIVSPIDGTVTSRNIEAGRSVGAGENETPLFVVAPDLAAMQVDARVDDENGAGIEVGDKATFSVESVADRVYSGEVSEVRPSPTGREGADEDSASRDVVIAAPNPDLSLAPGMKATAEIVIDRRDNVIRASDRSLRYSADRPASGQGPQAPQGGARLWLLRDGKPTAVTVQLGLDDGSYTEIVGGDLLPGDEVIVAEDDGRSESAKR